MLSAAELGSDQLSQHLNEQFPRMKNGLPIFDPYGTKFGNENFHWGPLWCAAWWEWSTDVSPVTIQREVCDASGQLGPGHYAGGQKPNQFRRQPARSLGHDCGQYRAGDDPVP